VELTDFRNVVLDTAPCIYFLEGSVSDRRRMLMDPLIESAESGRQWPPESGSEMRFFAFGLGGIRFLSSLAARSYAWATSESGA